MDVEKMLNDFNENHPPMDAYDYENGKYGLSIGFCEDPNFGRTAFDNFRSLIGGDEAHEDIRRYGNGYDWEAVFKKAFEGDPGLDRVEFDCEAGGFYCRSTDIQTLLDLGHRFFEITKDPRQFQELVNTAMMERLY